MRDPLPHARLLPARSLLARGSPFRSLRVPGLPVCGLPVPGLRVALGVAAVGVLLLALVAGSARWRAASAVVPAAAQDRYDVVLAGGRVIDPATGLDAVRHVGIRGDEIAAVSPEPLEGEVVIDASGLVVAPGFIDLHAHGQTNRANEFQARDGVTTALELESGVAGPRAFLERRTGNAVLNFGATVSHMAARAWAMPDRVGALEAAARRLDTHPERAEYALGSIASAVRYDPVAPDNYDALHDAVRQGLAEGALGIGMAHQYYPGATRKEILRVFELAAEERATIYTHVRSMGVGAIQEVVADAVATGAPLHIVHVNSSSLWTISTVLEMIGGVQGRGFDVTTEAYPYTAASTGIQSAIFDPGWQDNLRIGYGDIQWQDTGERLTAESFQRHRASGGTVIIHMMRPEWIREALSQDFVMVASDGMPYAPGAHPRSAGTFSRFLGRYVRDEGLVSLMNGLARITIMPARRLETTSAHARRKGRLQPGADADVTVFDPERIIDTATFEDDLSYSEGVVHVLVNGQFVVRDGALVAGATPGRALVGTIAGAGAGAGN